MANGAFHSPDEQALLRMVREAGSPQDAGRSLMERLAALEAEAAELEAYLAHQEAVAAAEAQARAGEESSEAPAAPGSNPA